MGRPTGWARTGRKRRMKRKICKTRSALNSYPVPSGQEGKSPVTESLAQTALWYIETNLRKELDLDEIAAAAGVSRYQHVAVHSRRVSGSRQIQYSRRRRMTEAAALLGSGRHAIIDVAMCCGYESQASFSRSFEAVLGLTPGRVRAGSAPHRNSTTGGSRHEHRHKSDTPKTRFASRHAERSESPALVKR